jgi:hypothetical protein
MKKEKMTKKNSDQSFEDQKLDLIRLRIKNGYYHNEQVLASVAREIMSKEINKNKR